MARIKTAHAHASGASEDKAIEGWLKGAYHTNLTLR